MVNYKEMTASKFSKEFRIKLNGSIEEDELIKKIEYRGRGVFAISGNKGEVTREVHRRYTGITYEDNLGFYKVKFEDGKIKYLAILKD